MSFMDVSELSREALETTYKLIRLRLFKADAKHDFIKEALQKIQDAESLKKKLSLYENLMLVLNDPKFYPKPNDDVSSPQELIGRRVVVFDRYHFAVPVKGEIREYNDHDGSLKITFDENNPGGTNVTKFNDMWFLSGQCQFDF